MASERRKKLLFLISKILLTLPSGVKLDDLDLIKRIGEAATSLDLRTVYNINVVDKRRLVELEVIGSNGSIIQDMGCEPVKISVFGEIIGPDSKSHVENLVNKFNANKPVEFSSDLSSIPEIGKVLIENLFVQEIAGSPCRYKYYLVFREYLDYNGAQSVQQPSQTQIAEQEVGNAIDSI